MEVKRRNQFAVTALVLSGGCSGCSVFEHKVENQVDHPYQLKLLNLESCPLPEHLNPKDVVLLSYRVRIQSNLASKVPANYFYASLLTTDGERYLSTYYGCAPLLTADPLGEGETADGFFNFSIPASKIPEKLVYSPKLLNISEQDALVELQVDPTADVRSAPVNP